MAVLNMLDLSGLDLVDGHCHGITTTPLDDAAFELWCTEADEPAPVGAPYLDSQVGLALRRWCAPLLGLDAGAGVEDYLWQRRRLGPEEAAGRLLRAACLSALLVDTGPAVSGLLPAPAVGALAAAPTHAVVRLEQLAESVAPVSGPDAFADAFADALRAALPGAVATKSIAAYRHGLGLDPTRPQPQEVRVAAARWLRDGGRLTDPVLLRHLLWCAVDTGLPIQLHTGFGDRDALLARTDPALLQPFCEATLRTGARLVLLHCYPYHRQAGWLAQVYPHVYADVGLTVAHLGARFTAVLAEFLELAPFGKLLYSSDAFGLPELYLIGAAQFRHSLGQVLGGFVADGALPATDALRIADQLGSANARRLYGL
ncbi:amidohydrolase family protein [Catellatospora sp. KI3]|uniref:amidohydrolase family protein n=1 Tax=Catellatospora sp. KI3 TaxID=3041620 RepID=UPI002482307F|nr:amidohydrolase family protein [Catellatospora sp. KI3]MDI1459550.1 amidohydrolase family protein [Catellatospora sp. KI3]